MVRSSARARSTSRTILGRSVLELRRRLGGDIRRLRVDAGLSQRAVAAAAGIDHGYLSLIEAGEREPSFGVLSSIGEVLGADLHVRLYPTTGPRIHDRIQAAMVEALFGALHSRWRRQAEVPVRRPARGYVDAVIASRADRLVIATEAQSELRRLEQQLRWASDKAESLPSSVAWPALVGDDERRTTISRLLLLRSSRTMRETARTFALTLHAAYPASTAEVHRALTTVDGAWPGPGVLWVDFIAGRGRILDRPPRGVSLGR